MRIPKISQKGKYNQHFDMFVPARVSLLLLDSEIQLKSHTLHHSLTKSSKPFIWWMYVVLGAMIQICIFNFFLLLLISMFFFACLAKKHFHTIDSNDNEKLQRMQMVFFLFVSMFLYVIGVKSSHVHWLCLAVRHSSHKIKLFDQPPNRGDAKRRKQFNLVFWGSGVLIIVPLNIRTKNLPLSLLL